ARCARRAGARGGMALAPLRARRRPPMRIPHATTAIAAAALAFGCATPERPQQAIAEADAAVRRADVGGEAAQYAPLELRMAREKLDAAREKLDEERYTDARRLAEQALADVRIAEARAQSQIARDSAQDDRKGVV